MDLLRAKIEHGPNPIPFGASLNARQREAQGLHVNTGFSPEQGAAAPSPSLRELKRREMEKYKSSPEFKVAMTLEGHPEEALPRVKRASVSSAHLSPTSSRRLSVATAYSMPGAPEAAAAMKHADMSPTEEEAEVVEDPDDLFRRTSHRKPPHVEPIRTEGFGHGGAAAGDFAQALSVLQSQLYAGQEASVRLRDGTVIELKSPGATGGKRSRGHSTGDDTDEAAEDTEGEPTDAEEEASAAADYDSLLDHHKDRLNLLFEASPLARFLRTQQAKKREAARRKRKEMAAAAAAAGIARPPPGLEEGSSEAVMKQDNDLYALCQRLAAQVKEYKIMLGEVVPGVNDDDDYDEPEFDGRAVSFELASELMDEVEDLEAEVERERLKGKVAASKPRARAPAVNVAKGPAGLVSPVVAPSYKSKPSSSKARRQRKQQSNLGDMVSQLSEMRKIAETLLATDLGLQVGHVLLCFVSVVATTLCLPLPVRFSLFSFYVV